MSVIVLLIVAGGAVAGAFLMPVGSLTIVGTGAMRWAARRMLPA